MNMNATVLEHGASPPPEKWTLRQQMETQAVAQALVAMEAELRRQARELGTKGSAVDEWAQRARVTFRVVGGRVRPVAAGRGASRHLASISSCCWERGTPAELGRWL